MLDFLGLSPDAQLLLCAALALALLISLIAALKLNSTLALIVASLFLGLSAGMKLSDIAASFQIGAGNILGPVAMVIALGAMLGKMLEECGGAQIIAARVTRAFGISRAAWAVFVIAILIGIPTFFFVGMVLLLPVVFSIARDGKIPVMRLGVPLVAALSCMHAMVPPHPGPMIAIDKLHIDAGKTIIYALLIGIPSAIVAGPLYGWWLNRRDTFPEADAVAQAHVAQRELKPAAAPGAAGTAISTPSFALALWTLFLPILLMLIAAVADFLLPLQSAARQWLDFFGGPLVSMLIAVLFSFYSFGIARGFKRDQILKFSSDCMGPLAAILLVVGAGGGFNQVLKDGGVGEAIKHYSARAALSPLLLGWLTAALIRIAAGSSTVAITAAVGIVAPMIAGRPDVNLELLVIGMGAGSLILSHLNDGGFWIVKEMFGLNVSQTVKCWTIPTTVASVLALLLALALQAVLK